MKPKTDSVDEKVPPIFVTKPHLPPLADLMPYLEKIWENRILTNNGPFHQELETALARYLGVKHISLFSNGTIALLASLRALGITGKVITTPYTFVATSHSLLWNNIEPVFVDVDPATLNMDPRRVEEALSDEVTAILPVHCYGTPCNIAALQSIADQHELKILYDAAHAFGVRHKGSSLLNAGDLSVLSFHATKVFNTFEGGAVVCHNMETKKLLDDLKNFGFQDETTVSNIGINGKMNEFCAALGLLQLKEIDHVIARRNTVEQRYRQRLNSLKSISLLPVPADTTGNNSYFPIFVNEYSLVDRDTLYNKLSDAGFCGRRYFFPLVSDMPMYCNFASAAPENLPIARRAAQQVICLPLYTDMDIRQVDRICQIIEEECGP